MVHIKENLKRCIIIDSRKDYNPPVTLPLIKKSFFRRVLLSLLPFNIRKAVLTQLLVTGGWEGWEQE